MKVMVIGSGGREHAISWKLAQSADIETVLCVPGNGGTAREKKCVNIDPSAQHYAKGLSFIDAAVRIAAHEKCDFAVVGPEDPLVAGIADKLWADGVPAVGPSAAAAVLEASKDAAKIFMEKYGVACAASRTFTDMNEALSHIERTDPPFVVKADGLAAGKGVVVAADRQTARDAVTGFMRDAALGEAGKKIIIEEYLQGTEISVLAAVSVRPGADSPYILPFVTARDHKRLEDGAKGPNTGGMGAIAPVPDVTEKQLRAFERTVLRPTLRGLIAEQMDYRGFLFFGLMMTADGPKLLEYNVRLGDPETQAVLPLMDSDFAALCRAIIDGSLASFSCAWKNGFVCAPVAVSGGYPGAYQKGLPVTIDEKAAARSGAKIFAAGMSLSADGKSLETAGGRVLAASAFGASPDEARRRAYEAMDAVSFEKMFFRRDIGLPGAAESGHL